MNTQEAINTSKICFHNLKYIYPACEINDSIFLYYDLTLKRCFQHKLKIFFGKNGFKKATIDDKDMSHDLKEFNWVLINFQCLSEFGNGENK